MYASKRRQRNFKRVRDTSKRANEPSNPSKRHRERLNGELETVANLLPYEDHIIQRLDKLSVLRLAVSYLHIKGHFSACAQSAHMRGGHCPEHPLAVNELCAHSPSTSAAMAVLPNGGIVPSLVHVRSGLPLVDPHEPHGTLLAQKALGGFVIILSQSAEIYYVTENIESYLGFLQSDVLHQSLYEMIHSEDRESLRQALLLTAAPSSVGGAAEASCGTDPMFRSVVARFRCLLDNTCGFIRVEIRGRLMVMHSSPSPSSACSYVESTQPPAKRRYALVAVCTPFVPPLLLDASAEDPILKTKHSLDMTISSMDNRLRCLLELDEASKAATHSFYSLVHPADAKFVAEAHASVLKYCSSGLMIYRLVGRVSGTIHYVQSSLRLFFKSGKPETIGGNHRLLTEVDGFALLEKRSSVKFRNVSFDDTLLQSPRLFNSANQQRNPSDGDSKPMTHQSIFRDPALMLPPSQLLSPPQLFAGFDGDASSLSSHFTSSSAAMTSLHELNAATNRCGAHHHALNGGQQHLKERKVRTYNHKNKSANKSASAVSEISSSAAGATTKMSNSKKVKSAKTKVNAKLSKLNGGGVGDTGNATATQCGTESAALKAAPSSAAIGERNGKTTDAWLSLPSSSMQPSASSMAPESQRGDVQPTPAAMYTTYASAPYFTAAVATSTSTAATSYRSADDDRRAHSGLDATNNNPLSALDDASSLQHTTCSADLGGSVGAATSSSMSSAIEMDYFLHPNHYQQQHQHQHQHQHYYPCTAVAAAANLYYDPTAVAATDYGYYYPVADAYNGTMSGSGGYLNGLLDGAMNRSYYVAAAAAADGLHHHQHPLALTSLALPATSGPNDYLGISIFNKNNNISNNDSSKLQSINFQNNINSFNNIGDELHLPVRMAAAATVALDSTSTNINALTPLQQQHGGVDCLTNNYWNVAGLSQAHHYHDDVGNPAMSHSSGSGYPNTFLTNFPQTAAVLVNDAAHSSLSGVYPSTNSVMPPSSGFNFFSEVVANTLFG